MISLALSRGREGWEDGVVVAVFFFFFTSGILSPDF